MTKRKSSANYFTNRTFPCWHDIWMDCKDLNASCQHLFCCHLHWCASTPKNYSEPLSKLIFCVILLFRELRIWIRQKKPQWMTWKRRNIWRIWRLLKHSKLLRVLNPLHPIQVFQSITEEKMGPITRVTTHLHIPILILHTARTQSPEPIQTTREVCFF